ncbi:MAG: hypothetical protein JW983_04760 [Elusimicrobia bacterium]|nr:hypothetical protein [Elusimicrobiota bacterium]
MKKIFICTVAVFLCFKSVSADTGRPQGESSLLSVTGNITNYANDVVLRELNTDKENDLLMQFLQIVNVLLDPDKGISSNNIKPNDFMSWMPLFLSTMPKEKKKIIKLLKKKYMGDHPSGIFFGPSADDLVRYRFAFGCSHYARVFIAVVKALKLVDNPENMRYAVSCLAEDYNKVLLNPKKKKTINGHQFVFVKIKNKWYAISANYPNDYIEFPKSFNLDKIDIKQKNIRIVFKSHPDKILLLRKIGRDYNDDCNDNTLKNLMNIYRSGEPDSSELKWELSVNPGGAGSSPR